MPNDMSSTVSRTQISEAEWTARCDLAALYRLAAINKYDDMLLTHISARIPGPERHFLINPFGLRFCEVTASSLVKIDIDGNIVAPTQYRYNYAGFVIHSCIHRAREDAHFIIHFHTDDGIAVASQKEGLLPLNQRALSVIRRLAYHDYEGVATSLDEQQRIVADLDDKTLMILRNHGTLAVGPTAGHAWTGIYSLEHACATQIKALSAGRENVLMAPADVQGRIRNAVARRDESAALAWKSLLRQVAKESPGYDL